MFKEVRSLFLQSHPGRTMGITRIALPLLFLSPGLALIIVSPVVGSSVDYPVGPGDSLYISVWGQESLSGTVTVGSDGTIVLPPPVGSIYVNGLSTKGITELLTGKLREYIKEPVVTVSIRSVQGFTVHILGQVQTPSFYQVPDGTSIQELITKAGGFTKLADPRSIILIHKEGETIERKVVDFSKFLEQADMESNPVLKANDVVVVPRMEIEEKAKQLVTVIGQVGAPGSYELEKPMSLLDVLTLANGALADADLSGVYILSRSEEDKGISRKVDLEAILSGKADPDSVESVISGGDTVFVPSIQKLEGRTFPVNVIGQVKNPGAYPVMENARLIDAIFKAGGLTANASIENISIIHSEQSGSTMSSFSLKDYLFEGDVRANPMLQVGDTVVVPMIETVEVISPVQAAFSPSIAVRLIGEVAKPGTYQVSARSSLLDVLALAGGPTSNAALSKTIIVRTDDNSKSQERKQQIKVDLQKVMTEARLELLPDILSGDIIFIPRVKEKHDGWKALVGLVADISTIVVAYYLISGKTYRR